MNTLNEQTTLTNKFTDIPRVRMLLAVAIRYYSQRISLVVHVKYIQKQLYLVAINNNSVVDLILNTIL